MKVNLKRANSSLIEYNVGNILLFNDDKETVAMVCEMPNGYGLINLETGELKADRRNLTELFNVEHANGDAGELINGAFYEDGVVHDS